MFDSHAHPGSINTKALVCSASTKEKEILSMFLFRSLGGLPGYICDLDVLREWAAKETFIGEVGIDKRYPDKPAQISSLHSILEIAEENRNIVTFHSVGWVNDFLSIVKSHKLEGFIVHGFTGSLDTLSSIVKYGGIVSLSPRSEGSKLLKNNEIHSYLPYLLTETDMTTGEEEITVLYKWNQKLSQLFSTDMEKKTESNLYQYLSSRTLKNPSILSEIIENK